MKRIFLASKIEINFFRTAIPIHLVAILQPTVMYLLMSTILVHPTFDMYITQPAIPEAEALVAAMRVVGSPNGAAYINPIIADSDQTGSLRQVIIVEEKDGQTIASQHFGLIDSNVVKNFRNRLTAAALGLWNNSLGSRAVQIDEKPRLPRDMPYTLYFGMAMLPLTVTVAASFIGGITTAQEFESGTILEYRLSPVSSGLVVGARLVRLLLTGLVSASILLAALQLFNGIWPQSIWKIGFILMPVCLVAGCLGICAGLIFRKSIPAFLVGLVTSFVGWLLGSAFGLAAGFNPLYEFISRLTLNTHAVELLFPHYFQEKIGKAGISILYMVIASIIMIGLTMVIYQRKVKDQG